MWLRLLAFALLSSRKDEHVESLKHIMTLINDAFASAEELLVLTACTRSMGNFLGIAAFFPVSMEVKWTTVSLDSSF